MMKNRLKTMRKYQSKTQQEVASFIGISQNAYSYWENGKTKIDNESIYKLATYYGVSVDFLIGRKYKMTIPPEKWHESIREDYYHADPYTREYMEYRHGGLVYIDDDTTIDNNEPPALLDSELEENVIIFHRDGKTQRKKFTKEQMTMLMAMVDAIPDTSDEKI